MKPLLIIPPCPARWHSMEELLDFEGPTRLEDLRRRFVEGVPGSRDAFAVVRDGGRILAHACVAARGPVGLLGSIYTRPEHRRRGLARSLVQMLVDWFEMIGGRWLYASCPVGAAERLLRPLSFAVLHRVPRDPEDQVSLMRRSPGADEDPYAGLAGDCTVRDATRADWPLIAGLLQHRCGPDPRVGLAESALDAPRFALELVTQQERGVCQVQLACQDGRVVALGSVATDQLGQRTYAMLLPYGRVPPVLREAILTCAQAKGYTQVEFPLETLAGPESAAPSTLEEPSGAPAAQTPVAAAAAPTSASAGQRGVSGESAGSLAHETRAATAERPARLADSSQVGEVQPGPAVSTDGGMAV